MVLSKDGARAEIIELYRYHKGEIRIRVTGSRKRDLLTAVRHELDKIHNSYERLKYNTLVPCNCSTCKNSRTPHSYQLQVLHRFLDNKQDQIQCQNSFQMVYVGGLFDDIQPVQPSKADTGTHVTMTFNAPTYGVAGNVERDQDVNSSRRDGDSKL